MQVTEIVLDGELAGDLWQPLGRVSQRREQGATILSVAVGDSEALARILDRLESLGIGVTEMRRVDAPATANPE